MRFVVATANVLFHRFAPLDEDVSTPGPLANEPMLSASLLREAKARQQAFTEIGGIVSLRDRICQAINESSRRTRDLHHNYKNRFTFMEWRKESRRYTESIAEEESFT